MSINIKKMFNKLLITSLAQGGGVTIVLYGIYFWARLKTSAPMTIISDSFLFLLSMYVAICAGTYAKLKRDATQSKNEAQKS